VPLHPYGLGLLEREVLQDPVLKSASMSSFSTMLARVQRRRSRIADSPHRPYETPRR
jgi:hypothetical protein